MNKIKIHLITKKDEKISTNKYPVKKIGVPVLLSFFQWGRLLQRIHFPEKSDNTVIKKNKENIMVELIMFMNFNKEICQGKMRSIPCGDLECD